MKKTRLDVLLFERGLTESREKARATVMSGVVFVNGRRADTPGSSVPDDCDIEVRGGTLKYVSRGGYKLERALDAFAIAPEGKLCLDCGASTGGFTDCLLQRGAARVYAVDVGYGQLAWSLRQDGRVVSIERANARYLTRAQIPETPSLAVIDVSFISLSLILPVVRGLAARDAEAVCLIKPQFEAGRDRVGKKGVVRDAETHVEVLDGFVKNAGNAGFSVRGITYSPIKGPEGNIEFLGYLGTGESAGLDTRGLVGEAHEALR
ncbi:MAG: TlyA family RNA methyltransferase [Oscillospiraceae bacterium]|nr:TlyA family RNA methyltransferase [Oscillospiraceae bacterium]